MYKRRLVDNHLTFFVLCFEGVGYREPVVRTHDQLGFIGPERAYTGPGMNMPIPVNMFISPMPQPFHPPQQPMQIRKLSTEFVFFTVLSS